MGKWLLLVLLLVPVAQAAVEVRDDNGEPVRLQQAAKRVVTLAPSTTELVAALAPASLVGVDSASDYPDDVRTLPRVGRYDGANVEAVMALKPDLVVAWSGDAMARSLAQLRALGIAVFISKPANPDEVADNLRRLGVLLGRDKQAVALAASLERRYARLKDRYAESRKLKVMLEISARPLMTVSDRDFLGRAIGDCGGLNVFGDAVAPYPIVSVEAVLARAPAMIISTSASADRQRWMRYSGLPAVAQGQLKVLDDDRLLRPGPRLVDGVAALCQVIDAARSARK
ncbi:cobalamin-binding protein [Jeongeupia naejangsanensis]|uniref:Cobalamin-binding protein n=1 Tax=Jeongeupia naejangsanensis TaxID=613195 RepID=A0ABS2BLH3_9NEIS|nr:cobalamin-binding protein [Jeongeupia naejangsanensis]MBM3116456.1 cobalamin-binding protein [Jeongeupia naejangsanensis]